MTRVRYVFSSELVVLTPLHVGSGRSKPIAGVGGKETKPPSNEPVLVARIVRDHADQPYLPASTLKGVFLHAAEGLRLAGEATGDPDLLDDLFGAIHDNASSTGKTGLLQFRGASRTGEIPSTSAMPYSAESSKPAPAVDAGIFIAARTAIDAKSGTAADGKLFFQEMVAPNTRFGFRVVLEARGGRAGQIDTAAVAFTRLLKALSGPGGFSAGKSTADGFGQLRVVAETVTIRKTILSASGTMDGGDVAAGLGFGAAVAPAAKSQPIEQVTLAFRCDGPFAILDSSRAAVRKRRGADADKERLQSQAQTLDGKLPLILGSSVSGALRARASWLQALADHRAGRAAKDDAEPTIIHSAKEIDRLSPVERLFGVTGFRGLVSIAGVDVTEGSPWDVTSVKLDRFSGAPVDSALFTTRTFVGVEFTLTLRLDARGEAVPRERDKALFKDLIADLRANGLQLGHGGAKGFGWFTVEGQ